MIKNETKKSNFISDKEKIIDMLELSKEEFLNSYSYLTEQEYENTMKEIMNKIFYNNIYLLTENSSWDYEKISESEIFRDLKQAQKKYKELIELRKLDMKEWINEENIIEEENIENESYSIYCEGDYDRFNCEIELKCIKF